MTIRSLKGIDLKDKVVLLRVDHNEAIDKKGRLLSDDRIKASLITIRFLLRKKAKIVIMTHLGRPKRREEIFETTKLAKRLSELLQRVVIKVGSCTGPRVQKEIRELDRSTILYLENLRFYKGEEANDKIFAKKLAALGEIYVNDAFSNAHRDHASMTGITKYLPSYAGLLVERELQTLKSALDSPQKPFTILVGGGKVESKLPALEKAATKASTILIGGKTCIPFLQEKKLLKEVEVFEKKIVQKARKILRDHSKKMIIPQDLAILRKGKKSTVRVSEVQKGDLILDIGPLTIEAYKKRIKKSKSLFWTGPMGDYKRKGFEKGTESLLQTIKKEKIKTIIGGGDTGSLAQKKKLSKEKVFVSTGGSASLKVLAGEKLPAIECLNRS